MEEYYICNSCHSVDTIKSNGDAAVCTECGSPEDYELITVKEEGAPIKKYMWLSFAKNDENVGVCVVEADSVIEAVHVAYELGINPGGEVMAVAMTEEQVEEENIEPNRLYTKDEMLERGYHTGGLNFEEEV